MEEEVKDNGQDAAEVKTDILQKIRELEQELANERTSWNRNITEMSIKIREDINKSMFLEAEAVSRRQELNELISEYAYEINRLLPSIKFMTKKLWEKYALQYQIKLNSSEKKMFVESDLRYAEAQIQAYQNHIEYLTETRKTVDHIIWSVKNKIQLYNITEMLG